MPDTYNYQAQDNTAATEAFNTEYGNIGTGHVAKRKWYRKYRSWAEFWRDTTQGALYGLNGTGPTDPLAQLQNQLMAQYQDQAAKGATNFQDKYNFGGMVDARNQGMAQALRQRAAGMGVQGGYQGTIDAATQARQTLVNQSMAAYRPMAYQAQQQIQTDTDQLINAISQADYEGRKAVTGAGRGA